MPNSVKPNSWLHDLIEVYNELGGEAAYKDVYPLAREKRTARGASWTPKSEQTIQNTVETHAESSKNFRGRAVFYSVYGHGKGVWALMPEYLTPTHPHENTPQYLSGEEGIFLEARYLRRSRDPRLVETRKKLDRYTCQACGYNLQLDNDNYIIDVHHLTPLSSAQSSITTSIDDLICLCPNCHRIAHSQKNAPLSVREIKAVLANRQDVSVENT